MKMKNLIVLLSGCLALLNTGSSAQSRSEFEHGHEDHVVMFERAREQQNEYFRQIQENIANGVPMDIDSGTCKYASSIFTAPPSKTVVLTFDDGPNSTLTIELLEILKKYDIKATFFMKGNQAKANPQAVAAVKAAGHIVANHSWDHPNFHELPAGTQASEVTAVDELLGSLMAPFKLFRYPYGNSTCATNALVKKTLGYAGIVGWHVDSCDWAFSKTGSVTPKQAKICEVRPENTSNFVGHVLSEIHRHNGGIVLMHEVHERTVANVEEIIVQLLSEGFQFTNLDDPRMTKYLF
jgi:peptidoglycan/xylan/chitin deacetylase (PgdA/CDA1 family)